MAHNQIAYNKVDHCQYGFMLGGDDWLVENNEVDGCSWTPRQQVRRLRLLAILRQGLRAKVQLLSRQQPAGNRDRVMSIALQTFTVNGEIAQDLLFENNTCFDFHQMCMVENHPAHRQRPGLDLPAAISSRPIPRR